MLEASIAILHIRNAKGLNDKMSLLKQYAEVEGLKDILKFIYNPYYKTGLSKAKLIKGFNMTAKTPVNTALTYKSAIEYFSKHNTGSDADAAFAATFIKSTDQLYGEAATWVAEALVTQSLQIGITATTLNKVYGDTFIPKIGCMLGTLYENVGPEKTQWPCIVTEKLDGIRRILIKENGVSRLYSRSGHEDTGLIEIVEEARYLPDNYVYDGELLAIGSFKDSIALRQATNSIANLKGKKTGLTFNVFDMIPIADFYAGVCTIPALHRKIRLAATLADKNLSLIDDDWFKRTAAFGIHRDLKHIGPVPILGMVKNMREVEPIVEAIWRRGGEGVMLNTADGPYEIKRSKHLLKVKHTEEHVLTVVDIAEGSNKYEGSMGALIVNYKGTNVGVGSGFTDDQRALIWQYPERYIGKKVEVETFGESTNAQGVVSLNCPIFKRFVGDEE